MGIFGPYYPPLLQPAISHAERFAVLLSCFEACRRPLAEAARAWLTGRTEEVEMVIGCLVEDWKAKRLSEEATEGAVSSYLRAVHAGARQHLGLDEVPECCLGDVAATVTLSPVDEEPATVAVVRAPDLPTGDTLVDPAAVLADMVGKHSR
ncbi:MAG TPA: hypothetical protein VGG39_37895 [Polyangiaceae bacterium]|jgi:hypothetical protein